jgi:hypothetical protein
MIAITAATWTSLGRRASVRPPRTIAMAASRPALDR